MKNWKLHHYRKTEKKYCSVLWVIETSVSVFPRQWDNMQKLDLALLMPVPNEESNDELRKDYIREKDYSIEEMLVGLG